jgi:filamentous hemagglutinin family protein
MNANHIYRVIWSEILATWVAVSEITRAHGKRSRKSLHLVVPSLLISGLALAADVPTSVVPTGSGTSAYVSANGVPVVNIKAANAAGLSHNQYLRYDVESKGLVLNNGNLTQFERPSQLAGSVLANPNLNQEARVILNEVVSTNRSLLYGFTEVVGGRADVVVANPNGITCSGCGFINTDRATLTTGTPQFGTSGGLSGFAVDRGDILIQGTGLNASAQQILDLVARSIKVEAPIVGSSATNLQLVTGANQWNYDARQVTGSVPGSGPAPTYAIDSSALGGMYAGKIRLIATEAGVGVRMLGEAAALADQFRIDAAGQVIIQNRISAHGDLGIFTTGSGADVTLVTQESSLSSGGNLTVSTAIGSGASLNNAGLMLAGGNLTVEADASISNGPSAAMSAPFGELNLTALNGDITNEGWLFSGTKVTALSSLGTFTNKGWLWSDGDLEISADSFINNNSVEVVNDAVITTQTSFRNEIEGGIPAKTTSEAVTVDPSQIWKVDAWDHTSCWPHAVCSYIAVFQDTITVTEAWAAGSDPDLNRVPQPQIVAGHDLTINLNNGTGRNTGGILSATNELRITAGANPGSFTNEAFGLYKRDYNRRWAEYSSDCFDCTEYYYYNYASSEYYYNALPSWEHGGFVFWWPIVGSNVHDPSSALYEQARSRAYRLIANTELVPGTNLRPAVMRGNRVTIDGGLTAANLGMTIERGGNPSGPSYYDPANPPTPNPPPTNPNGYFVPARDPAARYLIETNPLYGLGSDYLGSNYLLRSLGLDPETTEKRLGDANYEAYLIRQQLISQTGSAVLNGYASEAKQMERLMDQAVGESKNLGLMLGKPLTTEQIANLKQDIVWMVETTVAGQKVLQPIVYLAAESRKSIVSGAVIAGQEVSMNVASLSNTGGTISGARSLAITSQGDIANVGGTIKGGDVTLKSTEGDIVNQRAEGLGADTKYKTSVIEASGSLAMEAKEYITVRGATVKAGGDASIAAGKDITFDTVVDKSSTATWTAETSTNTVISAEKHTGSTLSVGGNLQIRSGGDTTLAGTKAEIGGDLKVDSGGGFNVLSRQDKTTTLTETAKYGFGVGGGLWGSEQTTTEDFIGKNVGSSIIVGGNADIKTVRDMTLQGSDLKIGGEGRIDAGAVKIEQGLDEQRTVTRTQTSAFLTSGSDTDSNASAQAAADSGRAAADASAKASAGASESSEFNLMESRTTTVEYSKTTGVASNLTTGGNLDIRAREAVTVQGSNVEAGGNLAIDAQRIDVLAGRNEEKTTTTTSASKIGIYTDSKAEAKADAGASATGMSATARAGANASAEAGSTVTFGTRMEDSTEQTTAITHTASSLKSGGDMSLKAADEAKFVGSKVESGGNLAIEAKDITSLAAQDSTVTTSSSSTKTAGIYLEGEASAKAGAEARVGPTGTKLEAGAEAGAEVSAGLRYAQEDKGSEQGSVTNQVSTFKAGGDITRKAAGTITDQGTQLEAGGNITQTATTLKGIAAEDKTWSSQSSESHDGRVGVYAGASASTEGGGDASAGVKGKYTYGQSSEAQMDTTAVTSRYKAGGSISSTTTDKTTLIGTQFEAGKDVSLSAGSLDYQAARDTHTSSSGSKAAEGEAKAKLVGSAGVELSGSYDQSSSSSASSTARAGGIMAGGNVTVRTQGDARFEGTDIGAGEKAKVESTAGNVVFDAAKSTSSEQSSGFNVSAKLGTSKKAGEGGKEGEKSSEGALGGGYSSSSASSTTSKAASIKGRDVEVSAGRDVTMEGTQVNAANDAAVTAGGTVKMLEAKDSNQSSSFGIQAGAKASKESGPESDKSSQSAKLDVKVANEDRQTGKATKIQSGGNLTVKGSAITSQQAELSAGGKTTVQGPVQQVQKTNVDKGMKVDVGVSASRKTETAKKDSAQTKDGKPVTQTKKPKTKKKRTSTSSTTQAAKPAGQ